MAIGQYTATPFNHQHPFPPDLRMKFPSLNDRDSLSPVIRWEGMIVYVDDQQKHYKLIGGTDNANWKEFQTFDAENYYTKTEVDNLLSDLGLNTGDAVLDAGQFNRSDATTVTITDANWRINDNEFTVTDTLTTNGTPTAGNKRWDLYTGDSSGNLNYLSGTEDPNPTKPAIPAGSLLIWEELRLDDGTRQPNPNPTPAQDFPPNRYFTAVTSNSTGLYAKVFEITVSGVNNYGFILDYQMPASASDGDTGRAGRLIVNITCASGVIDEIKMETVDGNSASGDWVILETTGTNTVQLFHKSTHFWGRVQFRVTFANSIINATHFISDESYAALPSADNQFDSSVFTAPATYPAAVERENNTVLFDKDYIIGNAAARTGNILFDFTGAQLGATTFMTHNDSVEPSLPATAVVISGTYTTGTNNHYGFLLIDKTASSEVVWVTIN